MRKSRFSIRFAQDPLTLFLFSLVLMTTPLSWVVAWFVCVAVHELGHLLMAWLLSVRVYGMTLGIWGASIEMEAMDPIQELMCAAAGPAAGCLLLFIGKLFPLLALFAFCQTVWNLLPFGQQDGARIIRSIWLMLRKIPCKLCEEGVQ